MCRCVVSQSVIRSTWQRYVEKFTKKNTHSEHSSMRASVCKSRLKAFEMQFQICVHFSFFHPIFNRDFTMKFILFAQTKCNQNCLDLTNFQQLILLCSCLLCYRRKNSHKYPDQNPANKSFTSCSPSFASPHPTWNPIAYNFLSHPTLFFSVWRKFYAFNFFNTIFLN